MPAVKKLESIILRELRPVTPKVIHSGNGRRLVGPVRTVQVADKFQLEAIISRTRSRPRNFSPPLRPEPTLITYGSCRDLYRGSGSKAILTADLGELYFVGNWSDLFGTSCRESQLGARFNRKDNDYDHWLWYVIKAERWQLELTREALAAACVAR